MADLAAPGKKWGWSKFFGPKMNRRAFRSTEEIFVIIVGACLTAIFSGLNRPLWVDEFLHFSLAGQPWSEVWSYIVLTSDTVNHGQTWFYQVISIFLLDVFGASFLGLRLVSWIATFSLLVSTYYFLRLFSVPMGLRLFVGGIVLANSYFSFEMGNGRAYILLVATTALTAYSLFSLLSPEKTRFSSKTFFGTVVTVGALNHPYFPVILGALVVGFLFTKGALRDEPLGAAFWSIRIQLGLTVASGLLSIVVGQLTWMRGSRDFASFDPFKAFKNFGLDVGVSEVFGLTVIFVLVGVLLLFWVVRVSRNSSLEPRLLIGLVFVLAGIGLSLFFTWISIWRNYWIFPRQWLAGAFLVFIGFAILAAVLLAYVANKKPRVVVMIGTGIVWVAALTMIAFASGRELYIAEQNRAWWDSLSSHSLATAEEDGYRFWDIAGNLNVKCGGRIWPELANFYDTSYSSEIALEEIKGLASSCADSE